MIILVCNEKIITANYKFKERDDSHKHHPKMPDVSRARCIKYKCIQIFLDA